MVARHHKFKFFAQLSMSVVFQLFNFISYLESCTFLYFIFIFAQIDVTQQHDAVDIGYKMDRYVTINVKCNLRNAILEIKYSFIN